MPIISIDLPNVNPNLHVSAPLANYRSYAAGEQCNFGDAVFPNANVLTYGWFCMRQNALMPATQWRPGDSNSDFRFSYGPGAGLQYVSGTTNAMIGIPIA